MIALTLEAETHVDRLISHYEAKGRIAAAVNLLNAIERAKLRIAMAPEAGSRSTASLPPH